MQPNKITVPETKPATEWVRGRPLQKVSPKYAHAVLQGAIVSALRAWARGRGRVGTEWRFYVAPPGEQARPLVPDIAYLSYERLPQRDVEAAQEPMMAPDAAVEILSPSDRRVDVEDKIDVYLRSGAGVVVLVDPAKRKFVAQTNKDSRQFIERDVFEHETLPDFQLDVAELFAELER